MIYTYTVHNITYATLRECVEPSGLKYEALKQRLNRAGGKQNVTSLEIPNGTLTINTIKLN